MSLRSSHLITSLTAMAALVFTVTPAATATPILFDIANPLIVVNQGGFTGSGVAEEETQVQVNFRFGSTQGFGGPFANTAFTISNIQATGDWAGGPVSFPNINVAAGINTTLSASSSAFTAYSGPLDFANSTISFQMPAGVFSSSDIGKEFGVRLRVTSPNTFSTDIDFQAVPEPGTLAMLAAGGAALGGGLIRRRQKR